jgi:hypothetical protein
MMHRILRFPLRRVGAILVCRECNDDGWLVLHGSRGWLHGNRRAALADAHWLRWNLGLPIREIVA